MIQTKSILKLINSCHNNNIKYGCTCGHENKLNVHNYICSSKYAIFTSIHQVDKIMTIYRCEIKTAHLSISCKSFLINEPLTMLGN